MYTVVLCIFFVLQMFNLFVYISSCTGGPLADLQLLSVELSIGVFGGPQVPRLSARSRGLPGGGQSHSRRLCCVGRTAW